MCIYRKVSVDMAAGAFFAGAKCLKFITFVWHFAGMRRCSRAQLVSWLPWSWLLRLLLLLSALGWLAACFECCRCQRAANAVA